jgi:hypothetical protein
MADVTKSKSGKAIQAAPEVNGLVSLKGTESDGPCGAEIPIVLDAASFRAGFKRLKIPAQGVGHDTFSLDDGLRDARSTCKYVRDILEHVCNQSEAHKTAVAEKVKGVRCTLLDDKDKNAAPQQVLDQGTWTVRYTWWSDNTADEPELGDPYAMGLAKTLGVEPRKHDYMDDGHGPEPKRCASPKECSSGQTCRSDSPVKGPRCAPPLPASCSKGGSAFGHADAKCPSGQWCSKYGVCFAKSDFPTEGHDLPDWATCYYSRECASNHCEQDGMNRFADVIGHCH